MAKTIKWGIMGCGRIADSYANDLALTKTGKLVAVGSRSKTKAKKFSASHGDARAYGSYEELAAAPEVDIVYVATPHPFHRDNTLLAIQHGKHVLCEKPIAMNARETRRMMAAAKKQGVFLMEAMWTRFFPVIHQLRKWLAEERIGTVLALEADFGIHFRVGPEHRIFNPDLGGGALLDLGVYPVSFVSMIFGIQPQKIRSTVHLAQTGVDDHAVIVFEYADSAVAALSCSSRVRTRHEARLFGTQGMIIVHDGFFHPDRITLQIEGKKPKTLHHPHPGNGMQFEADHVHQCLHQGKIQSDLMPLAESLDIMQTLDKIRRSWKLTYPSS